MQDKTHKRVNALNIQQTSQYKQTPDKMAEGRLPTFVQRGMFLLQQIGAVRIISLSASGICNLKRVMLNYAETFCLLSSVC